jgi:hypothetical protein
MGFNEMCIFSVDLPVPADRVSCVFAVIFPVVSPVISGCVSPL